jgi:flagellin-like hook-associated protein FlgL
MSAQDIFDARNPDDTVASGNVFAAMDALRIALRNDDQAAVENAVDGLKQASDHLNASLAFYGAVQNRIQDASSFSSRYQVQLTTEIGQKQDTDAVAAALELSQENVQLQAAFQMQANRPRTTLFDYLK